MRYAIGLMLVIGLVVGTVGGRALLSPSTAQDSTDDRIAALEQQVDAQNARLDEIEARLAELEGSSPTGSESAPAPSGDVVTISGSGGVVSDSFQLEAGRYEVTATVVVAEFDGFAAFVYSPGGQEDLLFNEIIDVPGEFTESVIYEATEDGSYFVETQNTNSPWTLTFEPR